MNAGPQMADIRAKLAEVLGYSCKMFSVAVFLGPPVTLVVPLETPMQLPQQFSPLETMWKRVSRYVVALCDPISHFLLSPTCFTPRTT